MSTRFDRVAGAVAVLTVAWMAVAWMLGDQPGAFAAPGFTIFVNVAHVVVAALATKFAASAGRSFDAGPARRAWLLIALGFALFTAGEAVDGYYEVLLRQNRPFPSAADGLFLGGYLGVALAFVAFVRLYGRSEFGGDLRRHVVPTAVFAVVTATGAAVLLRALLGGAGTLAERVLSATYPALDLAALLPAFVLTRITLPFRGGQIWSVWASILAGFVLTSGADLIFAYFTVRGIAAQDVVMEALYLLSYLAFARGSFVQRQLLA